MTKDEIFELNFLRDWFSSPRSMTYQNRLRLKRLKELTTKCLTFGE